MRFFLQISLVALIFVFSSLSPNSSETEKTSDFSLAAPGQNFGSVPCLNKKLSIVVYIVKDSLGVPSPPANIEQQILNMVDTANKDFAPICLSFKVCEFLYINNHQFDNMDTIQNPNDSLDDVKAIMIQNYKKNVINLYIVQDYTQSPADECGFTFMPPNAQNPDTLDFIALEKPCLQGQPKALSHLLGHFFGLYHTHQNPGSELIDGSNCAIVADSICDTPADPQGNADGACNYTGPYTPLNDPTQFYFPPIDNIMSYYKTCRCKFTREQYIRMAQQFLASRTYLW